MASVWTTIVAPRRRRLALRRISQAPQTGMEKTEGASVVVFRQEGYRRQPRQECRTAAPPNSLHPSQCIEELAHRLGSPVLRQRTSIVHLDRSVIPQLVNAGGSKPKVIRLEATVPH